MNIADITVLLILFLGSIIALRLGFIRVVLSMTTWIGATYATIYGYSYARPITREWIGNELMADIAAGAAIFVLAMIVLTFVSHTIAGGVRNSSFGMLDRSFGLLAGIAIGAAVISGGFIFSQQVFGVADTSDFYRDSKTLPLVKRGAYILAKTVPDEWGVTVPNMPAVNFDKQFRGLVSPRPTIDSDKRNSGYKRIERQEMDRLIRNHQ